MKRILILFSLLACIFVQAQEFERPAILADSLRGFNPTAVADTNYQKTTGAENIFGIQSYYASNVFRTGLTIGLADPFTFPIIDGTANQVLITDGGGTLSWTNSTLDAFSTVDATNINAVKFTKADATTFYESFGHIHNEYFLTTGGTISGGLKVDGGHTVNTTTVAAATYDLLITDYILNVTYTGTAAVTSLTLPTAQTIAGRIIVIKDAGALAGTNNITIDTEGAQTIDGAATLVISSNYDSVNLYCDGTNWFIY